ncbi:MAG: restriction endonuclease [Planctomycetes bacterium B3_Pla]|nr:MAG: restriction endonuclease [Planctomycetes bacterium B3_Pla]
MAKKAKANKAGRKITEALQVLEELGLPKQQQNERSALTLLSLLDLKPEDKWENASDPLIGITPMMEFFAAHYGKRYAPNTRETVRRQTVHQFVQAALILQNPDKPSRPTNSPKAVYQIGTSALKLLREFGKPNWKMRLQEYLKSVETLERLYAREREMRRIPLRLLTGEKITLSPGGQNVLVKKIIDDFCPLFTPAGQVIYVGDTQKKWAYFDVVALASLGVQIEEHGKIPDVVVHYTEKNWLVLIEAVTSHGPVNPKRRQELKQLFAGSHAGLVYVTAFLDRRTLLKYIDDISWETEVWIAESPTHLIHFNGERFLGPYEENQ